MGRRRGWLSAVKKTLGSEHKEYGSPRSRKSKKKWFAKQKNAASVGTSLGNKPGVLVSRTTEDFAVHALPNTEDPIVSTSRTMEDPVMPNFWKVEEPAVYAPLDVVEVKLTEAETSEHEHAYSVALATAATAKAAGAAAQAAVEIVRVTAVGRFAGKSMEEVAAIKIQTAYRGHKARRASRALRRLVRLKSLMQGSSVKRQTTSTVQCMQVLSRVQSQIRARRIRMSEENQALMQQLQRKHEKEMEKMKLTAGDDWNDSTKSKEKLEESFRYRQEAAMRRERALAYAHTHQKKCRNGSKAPNPTFMDPINPHWGWSWLDRWMAARLWETSTTEENNSKSSATRPLSVAETSKAYYAHRERHPDNTNKPLPIPQRTSRISTRRSPITPASKVPSSVPSAAKNLKSASSKEGMSSAAKNTTSANSKGSPDKVNEDSKSVSNVQSGRRRRHSVAGSSVKDNDSLSSTGSVRSYSVPKAVSRQQNSSGSDKNVTPQEKNLSAGSLKKRLSYSPSSSRRHSGPPALKP